MFHQKYVTTTLPKIELAPDKLRRRLAEVRPSVLAEPWEPYGLGDGSTLLPRDEDKKRRSRVHGTLVPRVHQSVVSK